ncbi:MAG TPA: ubiquinol-cytochrome c reductase iron-sulfur subunit [Caulobacteraceae bacterium]|nr:ubiquinol-cytochrome c reductase iron-sulfur subunit [Caulobacteraceae bacterium]
MADTTADSGMMTQATAAGESSRRDFIFYAAGAMTIGAAAAAAWPLLDQMEPAADALAVGSPITVDISKVQPGQQIIVVWRKNPMFIVRRTSAMLAELTNPAALAMLRDPNSETKQQPPYARNWARAVNPEYLVLVGICTHLGCIPGFRPVPAQLGPGWPGGWLCPCHGSKYDLAGRVFKSVPAPLNLPVPPYRFEGATSLVIGENPAGATFSMADIQTL